MDLNSIMSEKVVSSGRTIRKIENSIAASLIQALPQLKLLVTTGMRNNSIDLAACREKGVVVCGAPGHPSAQGGTAELSWALLLASSRNAG